MIVLENILQCSFPNVILEKAVTGKMALDKVIELDKAGTPQEIVFMDINMPEMDGVQSATLINQEFREGRLSARPFICALTAYGTDEMKRKVKMSGMQHFLTKPAESEAIDKVVKSVLD